MGALTALLLYALAPVPPLTGPVLDEAGLLDGRSVRALEALCRAAREREGGTGVQLQFLVVPSLQGEDLESFSMRVAERWQIGTKGKDNGVLVVVARDDRAVRIEVGGGIEGGLTDAQAGRIIRNTIAPAFRAGEYGAGLYAAGEQILGALGALPEGTARGRPAGRGPPVALPGVLPFFVHALASSGLIVFVILFLVFRILFGRRRRRFGWWGGPWGGGFGGGGFGGGSWGGGGGGGWSGGGGGFSGGGASGRW